MVGEAHFVHLENEIEATEIASLTAPEEEADYAVLTGWKVQ